MSGKNTAMSASGLQNNFVPGIVVIIHEKCSVDLDCQLGKTVLKAAEFRVVRSWSSPG